MFDDFQSETSQDHRKRMGGSMAAAVVLYGGLIAFAVATTAGATSKVVERLTQVEFAPPPPPPPPAPPPPPTADPAPLKNLRPKAKRKELKPPDKVPQEKPQESDAPLAAAEASGPVDGFTNGVEGGTGTKVAAAPPPPAAPPKPEPVSKPVADKSNPQPPYPAAAKRKDVEGVVVVAFDVLENGMVANAKIVSGPEEFHESVLKTIARWRFSPAKRGGRPMRFRTSTSVRFRLDDA